MIRRTLYVNDLAKLYFPNSSAKSAGTQLRRWIKANEYLKEKLSETYFSPYQRTLTPKQHQIIIEELGRP